VKQRPRHSLAFILSTIVHGSAVFWGSFSLGPRFEFPDIEIEFTEVEVLDPDQLQGDTKEPPPPEPVVAPPTGEGSADGEGAKDEEEKKPKTFGKRRSKVDQLAPTNSTLSLLLATKKVRDLPFAARGVDIMAPLPDFRFIIDGAGFDVLHDFDYLIIATPDVRDLTQTFLAVDSNLPPDELRAGIERSVALDGETIEWVERGGLTMGNPRPEDTERPDTDPRWFVFLDDSLAIYVREEFLPNILGEPDETDAKTSGNFVANLARIRRFAGREPRAGVQLVVKDFRASVRRTTLPFPLPDDLEMMSEDSENPEIVIKARFASGIDARKTETFWREGIPAALDESLSLKWSVKWIYDLIEVERKGRQLILRGQFDADQAEKVLELLASVSRMFMRKTPEEMEEARLRREENWRRRRQGKLPPSVLDESQTGASEGPSSEEETVEVGDEPAATPPEEGGERAATETEETPLPTPEAPAPNPADQPTPAEEPAPAGQPTPTGV
jgi:hypothetical protein